MDPVSLQNIGDKELYDFLVNAPKSFRESERIRKFQLKNGDYIHCVLWNFHFYITGTDIVKILIWRFQNAGRSIGAIKKFEEGIFSDLRNLKPGVDATLEGPRTKFLEFLYKNGCIRTQKKQKVFYWYSVPHDELFCDALERDLRRDTSIYTYNRYVQDTQRMHAPEIPRGDNGMIGMMPMHQGMAYRKNIGNNTGGMPGPVSTNDIFNIKEILFNNKEEQSRMTNMFNMSSKEYKPRGEYESKHDIEPYTESGFRSGNTCGPASPFKFQLQSEPIMDMALEPRAQRERLGIEKRTNFDDFDLSQFDFLKERCKEHLSRGRESCEQKLFEEKQGEDARSIDRRGEIRFIGGKNRE
ncbi:transcription factor STE12 [Pancytospora epiphaga]|nr:transcription factor STE12 [Pancytospora epiphaga]